MELFCLSLLSLFFLSFIFFPTSFRRQWAAFLGAWCPLPAFRSCFVAFTQHLNVLLMNLWQRKWSPHPIPLRTASSSDVCNLKIEPKAREAANYNSRELQSYPDHILPLSGYFHRSTVNVRLDQFGQMSFDVFSLVGRRQAHPIMTCVIPQCPFRVH